MQTPPPLSFDPVFMEDAQYAETNEKFNLPIFPIFIFLGYHENSSKIGVMTPQKMTKI